MPSSVRHLACPPTNLPFGDQDCKIAGNLAPPICSPTSYLLETTIPPHAHPPPPPRRLGLKGKLVGKDQDRKILLRNLARIIVRSFRHAVRSSSLQWFVVVAAVELAVVVVRGRRRGHIRGGLCFVQDFGLSSGCHQLPPRWLRMARISTSPDPLKVFTSP